MRNLCLYARLAVVMVCFAALALPQAMMEYAVAAAAGSAAGVAGKGVSDGLDKVLRKLDELAQKSAATGDVVAPIIEPGATGPRVPAPLSGDSSPAPVTVRSTAVARTAPSARWTSEQPVAARWVQGVPEPPRPEPTLRQLEEVETGTTRKQLVARLGPPSASILIPGDGQLREICHFIGRGVHLGKVRLTDGEVSAVEIDPTAR